MVASRPFILVISSFGILMMPGSHFHSPSGMEVVRLLSTVRTSTHMEAAAITRLARGRSLAVYWGKFPSYEYEDRQFNQHKCSVKDEGTRKRLRGRTRGRARRRGRHFRRRSM